MYPKLSSKISFSLRYHHFNPEYIHERLRQLGQKYELRILLVQVDVVCGGFAGKNLAMNLKFIISARILRDLQGTSKILLTGLATWRILTRAVKDLFKNH